MSELTGSQKRYHQHCLGHHGNEASADPYYWSTRFGSDHRTGKPDPLCALCVEEGAVVSSSSACDSKPLRVRPGVMGRLARHLAKRKTRRAEIGGLLLIDPDTREVVRYVKLRNHTLRPEKFQWDASEWRTKQAEAEAQGYIVALVHSHPSPWDMRPSKGDLSGANEAWLGMPFAIYCGGRLCFYELNKNRRTWRVLLADGRTGPWETSPS